MTIFLRFRIRRLISSLATKTTRAEGRRGWTNYLKKRARDYFQDVHTRLRDGSPLPALDIVRSLDQDGVSGGALLERIAKISNRLRRIAERQKPPKMPL